MKKLLLMSALLLLLPAANVAADNDTCALDPEQHVLVPLEDHQMLLELYDSCQKAELLPEDSPGMPGTWAKDGCDLPEDVVAYDKKELYNLLYDINFCIEIWGSLEAYEEPPCKNPQAAPWNRGCGRRA